MRKKFSWRGLRYAGYYGRTVSCGKKTSGREYIQITVTFVDFQELVQYTECCIHYDYLNTKYSAHPTRVGMIRRIQSSSPSDVCLSHARGNDLESTADFCWTTRLERGRAIGASSCFCELPKKLTIVVKSGLVTCFFKNCLCWSSVNQLDRLDSKKGFNDSKFGLSLHQT